jgi:hypothetical protein
LVFWLSLPGAVRLVTWTMLSSIEPCFDCNVTPVKSANPTRRPWTEFDAVLTSVREVNDMKGTAADVTVVGLYELKSLKKSGALETKGCEYS